jgi:hypothetical protein
VGRAFAARAAGFVAGLVAGFVAARVADFAAGFALARAGLADGFEAGRRDDARAAARAAFGLALAADLGLAAVGGAGAPCLARAAGFVPAFAAGRGLAAFAAPLLPWPRFDWAVVFIRDPLVQMPGPRGPVLTAARIIPPRRGDGTGPRRGCLVARDHRIAPHARRQSPIPLKI